MTTIVNVTIIHADGSPTTFQCFEGFSEFLARTESIIRRDGDPRGGVHLVFYYSVASKKLTQYLPTDILTLAKQAREMFSPADDDSN